MKLKTLNRFLIFVLFLILIGTIAGTAIALFKKNAIPGQGLEKIFNRPKDPSISVYGKDAGYNLIGKLWIQLKTEKNEKKSTLIISPWLEYKEDRAFYEEMEEKYVSIRNIITSYFSPMTEKEIRAKSEDEIKNEITQKINSILVLGKINKIYFNDFQFLQE